MISLHAGTYHTAMSCQCCFEERLALTSALCTNSAIMSCRQGPATVKGEEATPHQTGVLVVGVGGTVQEGAPMQHQCKLVVMELPMVGMLMEVRLSMSILTVQANVFRI